MRCRGKKHTEDSSGGNWKRANTSANAPRLASLRSNGSDTYSTIETPSSSSRFTFATSPFTTVASAFCSQKTKLKSNDYNNKRRLTACFFCFCFSRRSCVLVFMDLAFILFLDICSRLPLTAGTTLDCATMASVVREKTFIT